VDKVEMASYNAFCVSSKNFDNSDDAEIYCEQLQSIGAMGVVLERGEYFSLASIYPTLIEAQEVQTNLVALGYDAQVLKLEVGVISAEFNGENKDLVTSCIESFRTVFLGVFNACIDFDKDIQNEAQLKGLLAELWTKNKNLEQSLETLKDGLNDSQKTLLLDSMQQTNDIVEEILLFSGEKLALSSLMKRGAYEIVQTNISLAKNF
jgi:hypothetical protein